MLRQPKGGAVAIVAPAREGVPVFRGVPRDPRDGKTQDGTTQLLTRYWINGLGKGLTTGEALAQAKAELAADASEDAGFHWVLCELNLLGDPTLDMRASDPITPKVKCRKAVKVGTSTLTVSAGAPGLTVCVRKGDEVLQDAACGDGPIDAALQTIDRMTGIHGRLIDFALQAISVGKDAMGEVNVRVAFGDTTLSAKSASTDIVEAGAKAYLSCVNRLLSEREADEDAKPAKKKAPAKKKKAS